MASSTVGGFLAGFRTLLVARPALVGPPAVPVHLLDFGTWQDPEAIVFGRVTMSAARFLGWGAGQESLATIEPLSLSGYAFAELAGNSATEVQDAYGRVDLFRTEIMQQLRDSPDIAGALVAPQRLQPPLMDSALYRAWPADAEGTGTIRVRCDWSITWQAVT